MLFRSLYACFPVTISPEQSPVSETANSPNISRQNLSSTESESHYPSSSESSQTGGSRYKQAYNSLKRQIKKFNKHTPSPPKYLSPKRKLYFLKSQLHKLRIKYGSPKH